MACSAADPAAPATVDVASQPDPSLGPAQLALAVTADSSDTLSLDLAYWRDDQHPGMRMADITLRATGPVVFEAATPGEATTAADKDLLASVPAEGDVRLTILKTTNLNRVSSGVLGHLTYRRTGPGAASFEILALPPMLAPAEAGVGLHLPEILRVEGI